MKFFFLVLVAFFVLFLFWKAADSGGDPAQQAQEAQEIQAVAWCHLAVTKRLKAPATAKFGMGSDYGCGPAKDRPGTEACVVKGSVDSQNGFGALVRTNYGCLYRKEQNGEWTEEDVILAPV